MNKDILAREILNLTDTIKEQQEMVLSYNGTIPAIEMDILLGNIRKLYENIQELNKINKSIPELRKAVSLIAEPEKVQNNIVPEIEALNISPVVEIQNMNPELVTKTEEPLAYEEKVVFIEPAIVEPRIPESIPQASLASDRSKEFLKPAPKSKSIGSLFDEAHTVAETYPGTPTIYDKFGTEKDKSIGKKHQNDPVSDLRKSIGINEKFSFINELFDGDLAGYNEAIDKLNSSSNHNHALDILQIELRVKYQWSNEAHSFLQLKNLVDRRFINSGL